MTDAPTPPVDVDRFEPSGSESAATVSTGDREVDDILATVERTTGDGTLDDRLAAARQAQQALAARLSPTQRP